MDHPPGTGLAVLSGGPAGWLQWTLRPGDRSSAIATSLILLTLMPVARHGRLAMLDGKLTAMALLWLALLQLNRRHCSGLWGAVAGLMASAMLLLKAPLLVPSAVAAGLALVWSKEWKNWNHAKACSGMLLGLTPGIGWHLWHAHIRGSEALWLWGGDGAGRVLLDAGEGSDLGWRVPIIEVLEGGWPWLPLVPFALAFAWRYRKSRWGQWSLASLLPLAGALLPLRTQLLGTAIRSGCRSPVSALLCWSGWWSNPPPLPHLRSHLIVQGHPAAGCCCAFPCSGADSDSCSCCCG